MLALLASIALLEGNGTETLFHGSTVPCAAGFTLALSGSDRVAAKFPPAG
jgi:hypothetical protein